MERVDVRELYLVSSVAAVCLAALVWRGSASRSSRATSAHAAPQDPHAGHVQPQDQHTPGTRTANAGFSTREASGTAWLPDATPMYGFHRTAGTWQVMFHGNAFAQFLYEGGEEHRRSHQAGSINWFMAMARRPLGGGRLGVRGMVSLEPWTIPGCGYPDLLATGETCDGDAIHDRQHPHDLFMELAVEYDRPLTASLRCSCTEVRQESRRSGRLPFRTGPRRCRTRSRRSAITGSTPRTSRTGSSTAGVFGARWKAEASVFNGREPDEDRADLDLARAGLVSRAALTFLPTPALAVQVSAGHLADAEAAHAVGPRQDVDRVTASATWHRRRTGDALWATMVAWGMNVEPLDDVARGSARERLQR